MNRFLVMLAAAFAAVVVVPVASADLIGVNLSSAIDDLVAWDAGLAPLLGDPPPNGHEYVVGSQKVTLGTQVQHIRVSAHSLPGGVDPKGQVQVSFQNNAGVQVDVKGDVDCLNVGPGLGPPGQTEADVDAVLREPYMGMTHVTLIIIDNGNPGAFMGQSPDLAFFDLTNFPPPSNCSNGGASLVGDRSGNFIARDAP